MKSQIKAFPWLVLLAFGLFPTIQYAQPINLNQDSTSTVIIVSDPALSTQVVSLDLCDPQSSPSEKDLISIEALESINNTYVRSNSKSRILNENLKREIEQWHKSVEIYPNPSSDIINIRFHRSTTLHSVNSFEIYNTSGLKLYHHQFNLDQEVFAHQVDTVPFESGMYFVRTIFSDGSSTIHRFVKL